MEQNRINIPNIWSTDFNFVYGPHLAVIRSFYWIRAQKSILEGTEDHVRCGESNLDYLHVRQTLYPMCYHSIPCQLIFDQFSAENIKWNKTASSANSTGTIWNTLSNILKLDLYFTLYTKITSKSLEDLEIRPESIKYIDENIGKMF